VKSTMGRKGHRGAASAVLLVGGGAIAAAIWINGDHGVAVAVAVSYVILAALATIWSRGSGDLSAVLRAGGDERQRGLDRDSTAMMGIAMVLVAIIGGVVKTALDGDPGEYGIMCLVGGLAYGVSFAAFRRR